MEMEMKMKKLMFAALCIAFSVYGCKGKTEPNAGAKADVTASADAGAEGNGSWKKEVMNVKMELNVDLSEEKRLQEAADNGTQAWRKDAADVAHAALINQGINAKIEDCKIIEDHKYHLIVNAKCKDGDFKIHLKKLVKPDGIWTATEIDADRADQSQHDSVHQHGGQVHEGHDHSH